MVQQFERDGETEQTGDTDWVYSDLIKFYQLWSDVNGTRVDTWSSEVDILVDAYVEGSTAHIILNNLEAENTEFNLKTLGINDNRINSIDVKHLVTGTDNTMSLNESRISSVDNSITLDAESTMIIKLNFDAAIAIDQSNTETKHYANSYKHAITANTAITLNINDVNKGAQGEAILRLGIGRDHGQSLQPSVMINGNAVSVPADFRGYDQNLGGQARANFFGVIEIPVPYEYLQLNNTVLVEFTDTGGFISSAAIQAFEMSREVNRN
jgi:agarase